MNIINSNYKIPFVSIDKLKELGFKRSDVDTLAYKFPVLKYKRKTALECELMVNIEDTNEKTKVVKVNVFDLNHNIYAPFYNDEYGNYEFVLKEINSKILKEFKKLGIIKEKERCR